MGGWQSALPRAERPSPPRQQVEEVATSALADLCDAELLALQPATELLASFDWTYQFSDDGDVYRRGRAAEDRLRAELAKLPTERAAALWKLYAPVSMGAYRRT